MPSKQGQDHLGKAARAALLDDEGRVDRPIDSSGWNGPDRVAVLDDTLVYAFREPLTRWTAELNAMANASKEGTSWPDRQAAVLEASNRHSYRRVRPSRRVLTDFLRLADASTQSIVRFARRWGAIGICEHLLPCTHSGENPDSAGAPDVLRHNCEPMGARSVVLNGSFYIVFDEPIELWHWFSNKARATVNVAAAVRSGKPGAFADWATASQWIEKPPKKAKEFSGIKAARSLAYTDMRLDDDAVSEPAAREANEEAKRFIRCAKLAEILDEWLAMTGARISCFPRKGRMQVQLGGGSLLGQIAIQLVNAASATDGLAKCAGCGEYYMPYRALRPDRDNYCDGPECANRKASRRAAKRRYRQRKAAEGAQPRKSARTTQKGTTKSARSKRARRKP